MRANDDVFRRLDPSAGASSLATPVGVVAIALALLVGLVEPRVESSRLSTDAGGQFGASIRRFGGVTASKAFQKVVAEMETAAEEKVAAVELARLTVVADSEAVKAVEAAETAVRRAAAEREVAERAVADKEAAEKQAVERLRAETAAAERADVDQACACACAEA